MKKMNKKGFTLVEIMIVVAIIGLLAAIGIPSFQKARTNSIEKSKTNNIRIAEGAVSEWALDNSKLDTDTVDTDAVGSLIKGGTASLKVGTEDIVLPTTVAGTASYAN